MMITVNRKYMTLHEMILHDVMLWAGGFCFGYACMLRKHLKIMAKMDKYINAANENILKKIEELKKKIF